MIWTRIQLTLLAFCTVAVVASADDSLQESEPAATSQKTSKQYELIWSDEFDTDGPPNPNNWGYERGFVRNDELQWYQPENARCDGGFLVIEARREQVENSRYDPNGRDWRRNRQYAEYTSASLNTRRSRQWLYGRFEMRGRIDVRPGMWPAFWTLGTQRGWPAGGEIDIMEYYSGTLLANAAWLGRRGQARWDDFKRPISQFADPDWAKKFHVWRMDWDRDFIRLYVDDELLNEVPLDTTINRDRRRNNPFREPHYIILNLAVGGTRGGDPSATEFPGQFEVDYVRVFQEKSKPVAAAATEGSGDESAQPPFPVTIHVDAARDESELRPVWRFFGADEPNYAYMKDGKKLLAELGELRPGEVYFRTHNLLTSGDGTPALKWGSTGAYREDNEGNPIYDWTIVDRIFSTYLERGVRPYVQIGFMPKDLSRRPDPYQHRWTPTARYEEIYTGWAHPPTDYEKWQELVYQWTLHCVEKFGREETARWYWEVWNEPNIPYWQGTPEEFHKLHDHAIAAVRRALPEAKVGGPDVAGHGGEFMKEFLRHCLKGKNYATGGVGTPLDFVSFHAKGQPEYVDGHVRMGISNQLRTIDEGFRIIASYPELKRTPVVIGECDPEGCAACQGPQLSYRNSTMYSSYAAASFARIDALAERHGTNLEGVLTWAFEFEDQPPFAGFRALATSGIDLPVLNVFRMFARMSGRRVQVDSDAAILLEQMLTNGVRKRADVSAVASVDGERICILVWHYHDDDLPGPAANVSLEFSNVPDDVTSPTVRRFQIDAEHSNAYTAWRRMGEPQELTKAQLQELERQGQLAEIAPPEIHDLGSPRLKMKFLLPRQAVALLEVSRNHPAP